MLDKECSGDDFTKQTEEIAEQTLERISVEMGKKRITEDGYDSVVSQINAILDANKKLKCIIDSLPKESVSPEDIIKETEANNDD